MRTTQISQSDVQELNGSDDDDIFARGYESEEVVDSMVVSKKKLFVKFDSEDEEKEESYVDVQKVDGNK